MDHHFIDRMQGFCIYSFWSVFAEIMKIVLNLPSTSCLDLCYYVCACVDTARCSPYRPSLKPADIKAQLHWCSCWKSTASIIFPRHLLAQQFSFKRCSHCYCVVHQLNNIILSDCRTEGCLKHSVLGCLVLVCNFPPKST